MRCVRRKVAAAVGLALVGASAPHAQDIRVSVTGSNIKRAETETAAPIEIITREDIEASGLQTISDVLRQVTANNNGTIAPTFTGGFSASGSAISLRGLGPDNTLVLLNGRRLANFGLADDAHVSYADLQQIPFDAVERIEILKDGASAIYGADAVAGVVNVILRRQFTGFTATATAGTTQNQEGSQWHAAATGGVGDLTKDGYNAFVSVDYQKQAANPMNRARDYIGTQDLRFMGLPDTRPGNPFAFGATSLLGNVRPVNPATGALAGNYQSLPGPCAPTNQDQGFCRYDPKDYRDIQPEVERFNLFAQAIYDLAPQTQLYTELSYFDVKTSARDQPWSSRTTWFDASNLAVISANKIALPVGHPDNPFSAKGFDARLFYNDGPMGGRDARYDTGTQRYLAGIRGGVGGWDYDVAVLYIRSDTSITRFNLPRWDRLQQGLAGTSPYGYYRIGANASLNDPGIYDWIAPDLQYNVTSQNVVVDAKASRDVAKLDGGALALAVGYEFRREQVDNPGTYDTFTGNVVGLGFAGGTGSRSVNAVYAELYAPLLRNLEATVAARYDSYSDAGSTLNPKVGVRWTPIPELALRGTYARAFRAPGLYENGKSVGASGSSVAVDPVRCPVTQAPGDCSASILTVNVGSPNIKTETATTWTTGVVFEPVPGLSGTVDYWSIDTRNAITFGTAQAVVDNPAAFPSAIVVRDTNDLPGIPNSGSLISVWTPYENANIRTSGIDLDVTWRTSLRDWGSLTTELQWTHVFSFKQTFVNGQAYEYAGTQGNFDVSSGAGTPSDRANLIVSWQRGAWKTAGTVRYVSDYTQIPFEGVAIPAECLTRLNGATCHVSSFTTLDLSAIYTGFQRWQVFGSIINVFNRIAPFSPAVGGGGSYNYNFNYAQAGATGTQFNLGVRYTFD